MVEWIREPKHIKMTQYSLNYGSKKIAGAGFTFPCDEYGNVDYENWNIGMQRNYDACRNNTNDTYFEGFKRWTNSYTVPGVIKCEYCDAQVELGLPDVNECEKCGQLYNSLGQALAPIEEWQEDY